VFKAGVPVCCLPSSGLLPKQTIGLSDLDGGNRHVLPERQLAHPEERLARPERQFALLSGGLVPRLKRRNANTTLTAGTFSLNLPQVHQNMVCENTKDGTLLMSHCS
jgi:hypothetical protein